MKIKLAFALLLLAAVAFVISQSVNENTEVYITNSGRRYHLDGCSALSGSKNAVTLEDAVLSGYTACNICKPPARQPNAERPNAARTATLYRVNTAGLKTTAEADISRMVQAEVVGHVDGDTVRVSIPNPPDGLKVLEVVRLLGVDTPETVHPRKEVERFGKEASEFTKTRLLNRKVYLAFDWDLRDRYGRLLAYIYTSPGSTENADQSASLVCHNAALIREGYAHAYTIYAFQFTDEFRELEKQARQEKRGLWGD